MIGAQTLARLTLCVNLAGAPATETMVTTSTLTLVTTAAADVPEGPAREQADEDAGPGEPADRGPTADVVRASLDIDTSTVGAQSLVLLRRIEELGDIELRRAEILPGRGQDDPVIKISVRALEGGGYMIAGQLEVAGAVVANSPREIRCTLCTEGESVERARIEVDRLIPFVRAHADALAREAAAATSDTTGTDEPPAERPRLTAPAKAGVALLSVGVVGVGVGIPLALRAPTVKPDMPLETVSTRPAGYALLGVGAALVLTGTVLLVVGVRRARARPVTVVPGPGGLTVVGRF